MVEPNQDLARNLGALLSTMGDFRIAGQSSSGLDAMRMMADLSPDLLILDLSLPDISAIEVVRWAGRLFPETRVVLLSTHDLPEYRAAAARLKAAAFVSKAELCQKLPKVLARLRREQMARAGERGGVLVMGWVQGLRHLPDWLGQRAKARKQEPMWRFIHLAMGILSLEVIAVALLHGEGAPGLVLAGWVLLLAALARDFHTLRTCAASKFACAKGSRRHA